MDVYPGPFSILKRIVVDGTMALVPSVTVYVTFSILKRIVVDGTHAFDLDTASTAQTFQYPQTDRGRWNWREVLTRHYRRQAFSILKRIVVDGTRHSTPTPISYRDLSVSSNGSW